MKAVTQSKYGGPETLELRDVERPDVGDGEVLVRVHAASIHVGDWILMTGKPYVMRTVTGLRRPRNPIPGSDISGTVEAVGAGVERLAVGDEVFGWCAGAFAEFAVASQDQLVRKPANLTFEQASAVGVSATTALQLLRDHDIQPGQKILVNGASGGVGTFAVQIAKSFGAIVTGVTSTRNVELVASLGADHVIDYTREDFTTGTARYDLILDNVGNHSMARVRRVLTTTGTLISNGGGHKGGKLARTIRTMLVSMVDKQQAKPSVKTQNPDDLVALQVLVGSRAVAPVIDRTFALEESAAGHRPCRRGPRSWHGGPVDRPQVAGRLTPDRRRWPRGCRRPSLPSLDEPSVSQAREGGRAPRAPDGGRRRRARSSSLEKMLAMWASTVLRAIPRRSPMAWFDRPSAIRARTARSRSVRSSSGTRARRPTSTATTAGSITEPPRGDPSDRVGEIVEVGDPVLEQIADAAGTIAHQAHGERGLDVLGQDEDADRRPVFRADRLGRTQPFVGVGRWHPDVDDRHVRKVLARRPQQRRPRRRPGRPPRTRHRPGGARRLPARGSKSSARTSRRVIVGPTSARIAAPETCSLGMKPRASPFVRRRPYARASRLEVSTTNGGGPSIARARATSNPSTSGRPMSSRTKSGRRDRAASRPDAPSTAWPITSKPSASRTSRAWVRNRGSSSMIRIVLMRSIVPCEPGRLLQG